MDFCRFSKILFFSSIEKRFPVFEKKNKTVPSVKYQESDRSLSQKSKKIGFFSSKRKINLKEKIAKFYDDESGIMLKKMYARNRKRGQGTKGR